MKIRHFWCLHGLDDIHSSINSHSYVILKHMRSLRITSSVRHSPALCPDLLLWLPREICSPRQSYVWEHFLKEKNSKTSKPAQGSKGATYSERTIENLLHSFIAHLGSSESLQGHDGGISPIAQQQLAGLDVTRQRCPVQSRLSECVHSVDLESEQVKGLKSLFIVPPNEYCKTNQKQTFAPCFCSTSMISL